MHRLNRYRRLYENKLKSTYRFDKRKSITFITKRNEIKLKDRNKYVDNLVKRNNEKKKSNDGYYPT